MSAPTARLAAAVAVALCAIAAAPFLLAIGASDPASAAAGVAIELVLAVLAGWLASAGRAARGVAVALGVLALCAASAGALIWGLNSDSNWI